MKNTHIQIRLTAEQKSKIEQAANKAGLGMSAWLLARLFPSLNQQLAQLVEKLAKTKDSSFVFAEMNDFLSKLNAEELEQAISGLSINKLEIFEQNYLAAMIELACEKKLIPCPELKTEQLVSPWFATELESLKLYLLLKSPIPFRKRNIFIDSSLGDRC